MLAYSTRVATSVAQLVPAEAPPGVNSSLVTVAVCELPSVERVAVRVTRRVPTSRPVLSYW